MEEVKSVPVQEAAVGHADLLAGTRFFGDLSRTQLEHVAQLCSLQRFPEGALVYSLGGKAHSFYVLVEGMVRFTIALGNRQAAAGQLLRCGEVFGWGALVEPTPARIASAVCVTPCTVLGINGKELLRLAGADHDIGYPIMKQLSALISANLTSFAAG